MLTTEQQYVTWDVVFGVLRADDIPVNIRALFCQLSIALYVDVSENCSLLETSSYTYLYDRLDLNKTAEDWLDQQAQFVSSLILIKMVLLILELALELQFKYKVEVVLAAYLCLIPQILVATFTDIEKGDCATSRHKKALADFLTEYHDKTSLFNW
ncbi:hypothetical protein LSH36_220g02002 [Paralvinella palmiformis]|uniref:Uncharacterized protein n=1 Tax=Paralvinella palmiformis TaxID=53620 RepID=A0AAD9JNT8_9ANNE|nr:hypothetical protein LSH36_220g02002 [Paralvinella palmiformis]